MDHFDSARVEPDLPNAEISYIPGFVNAATANDYLQLFLKTLDWQQHYIRIFGKTIPQPRLTALYAENEKTYSYSNLQLTPTTFTPKLQTLQVLLSGYTGIHFTHCLANLYRDGSDSMGWHADDEPELGKNPVIASLSFGGKRNFQLKHKSRDMKYQLELEHGSLLLMAGTTQEYWKHQLPKTSKPVPPRVNLTFRVIK